jgi:hypothetical protein
MRAAGRTAEPVLSIPAAGPRFADHCPQLTRFFVCIGAEKAGTTWLYMMLKRHPDIHLPRIKELHYWDWKIDKADRFSKRKADMGIRAARKDLLGAFPRPHAMLDAARRIALWRDYRGLLASVGSPGSEERYVKFVLKGYRGQPVAGELTPNYQLIAAADLAAISKLHADTRFIFIMRDPVERLWSGVKHAYRCKLESGDVDHSALCDAFRARAGDPTSRARRRSDYRTTLKALDEAVPQDRVLYMFYENLFDPDAFGLVTDFLGVRPMEIDIGARFNGSRAPDLRPSAADLVMARTELAPIYDAVKKRFGAATPASWMAG